MQAFEFIMHSSNKIIMYKRAFIAVVICALLCMLIFIVQYNPHVFSMLNGTYKTSSFLEHAFNVHQQLPAFSKRPLTSLSIDWVHNFGVSISSAFIIVDFTFYFLSGVVLFYLSLLLHPNVKMAILNVIAYFLCFSNLFAFSIPIYAYDDPLQFLLIFISLYLLVKQHWVGYIFFFFLSLVTRESGVILLPAIGLFVIKKDDYSLKGFFNWVYINKIFILCIPVVLYFVFIQQFIHVKGLEEATKNDFLERFQHVKLNFGQQMFAAESLTNVFLVLGIPLLLTFLVSTKVEFKYKNWVNAFLVTAVLNTIVVLLTTKAREARLLSLPLVFLWPVFGNEFKTPLKTLFKFARLKRNFFNIRMMCFLLLEILFAGFFAFTAYKITDGWINKSFFREYLFIYTLIWFSILRNRFYLFKSRTSI